MKKLFIAAIAVFAFTTAQAQKSEAKSNGGAGSILLAGNIGFGSEKYGATGFDKYNSFDFSPRVGYQFNDNMTVGIDASIMSSKATTENGISAGKDLENKSNTTKLGAFLRYAESLGGSWSVYGDLAAGMQNMKFSNNVTGSTDTKYKGMYVGLTPAVAVDLKNRFCLNFSIGGLNYSSMKGDWTGAQQSNSFDFNFGKQVNIGISKNF